MFIMNTCSFTVPPTLIAEIDYKVTFWTVFPRFWRGNSEAQHQSALWERRTQTPDGPEEDRMSPLRWAAAVQYKEDSITLW